MQCKVVNKKNTQTESSDYQRKKFTLNYIYIRLDKRNYRFVTHENKKSGKNFHFAIIMMY